jgi:murein L,D-transpeptidase YafK
MHSRRSIIRIAAHLPAVAVGLPLFATGSEAATRRAVAVAPRLPVIDSVLVEKSVKRLHLLRNGSVFRTYPVALGRYPDGPKRQEGDAKTPEGLYTLDRRLDRSAFYKAIHISYPNDADREIARQRGVRPGGKIMIHGLANGWSARQLGHPRLNWTQGCIAVTNAEMDEIWDLIDVGTPIEIRA